MWIVLWIMLQIKARNAGKCGKSMERDQNQFLIGMGKPVSGLVFHDHDIVVCQAYPVFTFYSEF